VTVRIGSNIASLRSQRALGQASDRIGEVYRRLSTGQRINRAADDAAGLAIAESLSSKSRVFTRGAQNVSDGLSALSIADSAVESLIQITTRIQELAEQGANGSYSSRQRAALDKEAQTLRSEFFRIVQSTTFNGRALLTGGVQGLQIQAGYGAEGVIASSVGGKLGTGSFSSAQASGVGVVSHTIAASDLNGDGLQDIVTASFSGNTLSVSLGNGNGTFRTPTSLTVGSSISSIANSDFNRDGIQDLVTANHASSFGDTVSVLLGKGDGRFGDQTSFAVGIGVYALATSDLNGDGNQDIITANASFTDNVSVILGNGDGSFGAANHLLAGVNPLSLSVADFNGDGIQDLVTANQADNDVSVFLGTGNGTFGARNDFAVGLDPISVAISDFNSDGLKDLAVANQGDRNISVLLGNGNGTFQTQQTFLTNFNPNSVTTSDLNGDGIEDIVTANSSSDTVSILLGKGDGTFGSYSSLTGGGGDGLDVAIADFNGDGVPDVATSNGDSTVTTHSALTQDGVQPLLPISLKTQADSKQALSIVSKKLELLSAQRGVIGASQSRLLTGSRALLSQRDDLELGTLIFQARRLSLPVARYFKTPPPR